MGKPILSGTFARSFFRSAFPGTFFGVSDGSSIPALPKDGPSGAISVPSVSAHFPMVNAAIPTPSFYWLVQEPSGDLVDSLNSVHMVQTGAGTYQNALTNWSTIKFLGMTETAAQCWGAALGTGWNVNTQSVFLYGLVHFASTTGVRRWFVINGTTFYCEQLSNGLMRLNGGTSGLLDHRSANVRPFVIEMIGGAGMTGHSGAGTFRLSTDIEQVTGTWSSQPDNTKGFGCVSAAAAAPPVCNFGPLAGWVGTDAEALSTFTPKAFIQSFGWSVSGY